MPLLLKNNQLLSERDIRTKVIHELERNLFLNHNYLRDKIIRVSFRGLEPQAAVSAFKRYYEYPDDMESFVSWSDSTTMVSMTVIFTVLYAYTQQAARTNDSSVFLKMFFVEEDYGVRFLPSRTLVRSEAADAVAVGFEQKSFQSFLKNLPYKKYNELLIPIFRYGNDELISRVSDEILFGFSEDEDEMIFRKSVLNKLLLLSDTDQAAVRHDAIYYGLDDEAIVLKTNKVSMFTYVYPDIELIEVTDHYGNDRSEDMSSSYIYKNMKGFKGIIITKDERMSILYPDRRIKIHTSPVKEHTVCKMSDGSIVHTVVTQNSIYRFKENKKEPEIDIQEED